MIPTGEWQAKAVEQEEGIRKLLFLYVVKVEAVLFLRHTGCQWLKSALKCRQETRSVLMVASNRKRSRLAQCSVLQGPEPWSQLPGPQLGVQSTFPKRTELGRPAS